MKPKTETGRKIAEQLTTARAAAAQLETDRKAMIDTAVAEETSNTEDFKAKYTAARKAEGEAKDGVSVLEQMLNDVEVDAGAAPHPLAGVAAATRQVRRETPGSRFTGSDLYKRLSAEGVLKRESIGGETPDVELVSREEFYGAITHEEGSAGVLVLPEIRPDIVGLPQLKLSILDLISMTTTDSDTVRFHVESLFDNNAATIAEGGDYPESDIQFDDVDIRVKKIGHLATTTWEMTKDAPRLDSWINRRMVYGALAELQRQIIAEDGSDENLVGMYNWDNILSYELLDGESVTDGILKAMVAIEIASKGELSPTGVGLHPLDYQSEVLSRNETNGLYLYGGPLSPLPQTMWGLVPVRHASFPQARPMVAAFREWEVAVNSGVSVSMSDQHGDNFGKDLVTYKARLRAAAGTERAYAFCTVDPYSPC